MTDERFEQLMRDAAQTYRRPPEPPLDGMWAEIERSAFGTDDAAGDGERPLVLARWRRQPAPRGTVFRMRLWLQAAAVLVVGIGIGRLTAPAGFGTAPVSAPGLAAVDMLDAPAGGTERVLDQATALLTALPVELEATQKDPGFGRRARDLLFQTRWLLDSPELQDPALHALLEDLENVLVQVVRLEADADPFKRDLLAESLEQSDVLPRLRVAMAHHMMD